FALFRSARVVPFRQRLCYLALLARFAFCFLAFFFTQCGCICHDCGFFLAQSLCSENLRSVVVISKSAPRAIRRTHVSRLLQLGVLFYQLLQIEARELYCNLVFFSFSFGLSDQPIPIFPVSYLIARFVS